MSTVKSKKLQVGTDATSSNNFTIYQPAVPDGTLRIGVGNADNPTEVARFDSTGMVGGGKILQVVSTTKTDTFSTGTTGSYVDITGMSASITPTSATSKILVIFNGNASGQSGTNGFHLQLVRGSTAICVGDTVAGKVDSSTGGPSPDSNWSLSCGINYLDSPSTTSATTYKIQCRIGAGNFYFNRSQSDGAGALRAASTITLMEIAG